jgi:hypothetical protein
MLSQREVKEEGREGREEREKRKEERIGMKERGEGGRKRGGRKIGEGGREGSKKERGRGRGRKRKERDGEGFSESLGCIYARKYENKREGENGGDNRENGRILWACSEIHALAKPTLIHHS